MHPAKNPGIAQKPPSLQWPEVIGHVRQRDPSAEELVVRFFQPRVLAMASVRLKDRDAARDITQETLLAILQAVRMDQVHEIDKLAAFVAGTARNLINNYLRAKSRNPDPLPLSEEIVMVHPSPMDEHERRVRVRAALKLLKPQDRRILLLTLVDGMSPREIASLIGLKPGLVRTRKTRAIKFLRQEIARVTRRRTSDHVL
jgi:RNA polymerase sigma factor (sigma-70 family)